MRKLYTYTVTTGTTPEGQPITQDKTLTLDFRIAPLTEEGAPENPTGDPSAYFYEIAIDEGQKSFQTFQPGVDGFEPMDEQEAAQYLEANIEQIVTTYQATEVVE